MKILAIVPAYNEERNIGPVIESLKERMPALDILVVNDGSTDDTSQTASATKKALVVDLPCNLGIGGAVQTGFLHAVKEGYDAAFQFDGDGQHLGSEVDKLLAPILAGEADVVIGSRFLSGNGGFRSTRTRRAGIKIFQWVNSFLTGHRITDNTSGFRAYNKRAITFLSRDYPSDYPEPEAVILLGRNGFRLKEVPVEMKERASGRSSITAFRSLYYMVKVLLAIFVTALRPGQTP
ncbi:MAG: glycosyltransferase family 2 protein [Candidatus Aminicenantes bacterium]|nr:glycosyltransferase family 2 protein [Candidatus Aminicenantes bacterium]